MECLPAEIPNAIEVDVSGLGLNDAIYVRDVGQGRDLAVGDRRRHDAGARRDAARGRGAGAGAETAAAPVAAAPGSEPEVIKKGKTEKEGEAKAEKKK